MNNKIFRYLCFFAAGFLGWFLFRALLPHGWHPASHPIEGADSPENTARMEALKKKATAGDAVAQYELGKNYESGMLIQHSYTDAYHWMLKSAEQGYAPAQCAVGTLIVGGCGTTADLKLGMSWTEKAARQGYPMAINNTAAYLFNQKDVIGSKVVAVAWGKLAMERYAPKEPAIADMLKRAESELSSEERAEADALFIRLRGEIPVGKQEW